MKKLLIFSAGTGGVEILKIIVEDINKSRPTWEFIGFVDPYFEGGDHRLCGYPVFTGDLPAPADDIFAATCMMDNRIRRKIIEEEIEGNGYKLTSLIHPSVILPSDWQDPPGFIAFPGVKINHSCKFGKGIIAHYNTVIGHDLDIGDYVFFGPSVTACSRSAIGDNSTLGAGSVLIPGSIIGHDAVVGAGMTVFSKVKDYTSVVALPRTITTRLK